MNLVDEYISLQDAAVQPRLNQIQDVLRSALPEAEERISYQMPTYWKGHNIIHFAAYKHHIGLYLGGEVTTVFADQLKGYKTSKGAIQFPHDRELPLELITEIAKWAYGRYAK